MKNLVFSTFLIALYALVELISCDEKDAINFLNSFLKFYKWKSFKIDTINDLDQNEKVITYFLLVDTPYGRKNYVTTNDLPKRLNRAMLLVNYLYTQSLIFVTNFITEKKEDCDQIIQLHGIITDQDGLAKCVKKLKWFIIRTRDMTKRYIGVINYIKNLSDTIKTDYFILPVLEELDTLARQLIYLEDDVNKDMKLIWETITDVEKKIDQVIEKYHIYSAEYKSSYGDYYYYLAECKESKIIPLSFTDYFQNKLFNGIDECIENEYTNLGFKYDIVKHETIYEKD